MVITGTRTICIVGANEQVHARLAALLDEHRTELTARWRMAERAGADLLLVDAESVHGHMDWLREKANGRLVAACTSQPEAYKDELWLSKPIVAAELVELLNRVGARAAATAPADDVDPYAITQPAPPPRPTPPASLLALLEGADAAGQRLCLAADGLPTLLLDPAARSWRAEGNLKSLAAWCSRVLADGDVRHPTPDEFDAATANLPAQPYARLIWLAHLTRGGGRLDARFDPESRFKLASWPQSEREFPKHFRIATAMLKEAGTLEDIAGRSGAPVGDVADFVNAYHAIGHVDVSAPAAAVEASQRGLFGRMRKSSTNS